MPRGNAPQTKIHYKGEHDDFIIFADSAEDVEKWKKDRTVPLAQVVSGFKIFKTDNHGNQGKLGGASKAELENEFGTSKDDEVVTKILEKGTIIETEESGRGGDKNLQNGPRVAH